MKGMMQMKRATKRLTAIAVALFTLATVLATTSASAGASERADRTYRVTITNDTRAQYFTPGNLAAHGRERLFGYGREASPGIQAVAENGGVPVLQQEWADRGLDSFVIGSAPIAPGESATFEISTNERRFSVVTMLICTNDGFGGVNNRRLPARVGQTTRDVIRSYDAGTEINTELDADFVPAPFCGDPEVGSGESNPALAENGVIRRHRGIKGVGDVPQKYDFGRFVGDVVIERIG